MPSRTRPMSVATPTSTFIGGAPARWCPRGSCRPAAPWRAPRAAGRSRTCRSSSPGPRRTTCRSCRRSARAAARRVRVVDRELALGRAADRHARTRIRTVRGFAPSAGCTTTADGPGVAVGRGGARALRAVRRRAPGRFDGEAADRPAHRPPHEQEQQREQAVLQGESANGVDAARRHRHALRNSSTVVPIVMRSPSASSPVWTV